MLKSVKPAFTEKNRDITSLNYINQFSSLLIGCQQPCNREHPNPIATSRREGFNFYRSMVRS
ncbi:hypothetical protein [[Phormidium] sp. ETS-05]|uniref:hypothetical protein n=1 Tax=[Phormidium] sp. ETS-05 TaxID=222819 RepID=UPI0018EECDCA|nr:hypothetical protein [[Phormidium] sp. ETS-05]